MTIFGTANFVSRAKAYAYYKDYGLTPNDVNQKIHLGEIHIGRPETFLKSDRIVLLDGGRRYGIETRD